MKTIGLEKYLDELTNLLDRQCYDNFFQQENLSKICPNQQFSEEIKNLFVHFLFIFFTNYWLWYYCRFLIFHQQTDENFANFLRNLLDSTN